MVRPAGLIMGGSDGRAGVISGAPGYPVVFEFDPALTLFLRGPRRSGRAEVWYDAASSLGHMIEAAGVPLTEVGELRIGPRRARPAERIPPGQAVTVGPAPRPQALPAGASRFALDAHLGALARRLRLVGLDTWYRNDVSDDELIAVAVRDGRMLLTRDRGLLRRRAVRHGAYVRGDAPDDQLLDVLDRFAPPLAPWTRCPACNGTLAPVPKADIEPRLQPGTRRTYDTFARCRECGRAYWRGAHGRRLEGLVARGEQAVARRRGQAGRDGGGGAPPLTADAGGAAGGTGPAPRGTPGR